jgi:hypothetical protein
MFYLPAGYRELCKDCYTKTIAHVDLELALDRRTLDWPLDALHLVLSAADLDASKHFSLLLSFLSLVY